jgi:hypothetical protein
MQVAEHEDRAIGVLGERVYPGTLKVHPPKRNGNPALSGEGTGALERLGGDIATRHFQPALGQENPVMPVPTGEIKYRPRQGFFCKQLEAPEEEFCGLDCLWERVHGTIPHTALARIVHEPPAATAAMAVLPGVLGSRTLRRTDKYASAPVPRYRGMVARHATQAPALRVAQPSPRSRDGVSCIMRAKQAPSRARRPALGAIAEVALEAGAAAVAAGLTEVYPWTVDASALVGHVAATLALDEGLAPPDPQNRNEEEGKVLIDPGEIGAAQAAVGAKARLLVKAFLSRSDPADTDKDHN